MEMVLISAGSFQMGSDDDSSWSWCHEDNNCDFCTNCELPVHTVNINYNFYMCKTEITQAQWLAVMSSWPSYWPSSTYGLGDNFPAYYISWDDCQNFVLALNQLGQGTFRLPSEAEWEYACRAGTTMRFYFGNSDGCDTECEDCAAGTLPANRSDYMWYCGNNGSDGTPQYGSKAVGAKLSNAFGLFDMSGNIWEWCQDYWHDGYDGAPADGSAWELPASLYRVFRGGDWDSNAQNCRSCARNGSYSDYRDYNIGVRIVRTTDETFPTPTPTATETSTPMSTAAQPTATPSLTNTPIQPTNTQVPPTNTPIPPTHTPVPPPTNTPVPSPTNTPSGDNDTLRIQGTVVVRDAYTHVQLPIPPYTKVASFGNSWDEIGSPVASVGTDGSFSILLDPPNGNADVTSVGDVYTAQYFLTAWVDQNNNNYKDGDERDLSYYYTQHALMCVYSSSFNLWLLPNSEQISGGGSKEHDFTIDKYHDYPE